jgi:hypothetical protein
VVSPITENADRDELVSVLDDNAVLRNCMQLEIFGYLIAFSEAFTIDNYHPQRAIIGIDMARKFNIIDCDVRG